MAGASAAWNFLTKRMRFLLPGKGFTGGHCNVCSGQKFSDEPNAGPAAGISFRRRPLQLLQWTGIFFSSRCSRLTCCLSGQVIEARATGCRNAEHCSARGDSFAQAEQCSVLH